MHIDLFFERNLPSEPLAWIDATRPRVLWVKAFEIALVIDRRKRVPAEPSPFEGACLAPKRPRGKLGEIK